MSGTLTWDHAVADIPESGLSTVRRATPDELELIVRALGLITCSSLTATYTIQPTGGGHFRLNGRLEASLEQACVVTLEPVAEQVDEMFEVPLAYVMAAENMQRHSRDWQGMTRHYYAITFGQRYIWGVTAGILRNLHDRIWRE